MSRDTRKCARSIHSLPSLTEADAEYNEAEQALQGLEAEDEGSLSSEAADAVDDE